MTQVGKRIKQAGIIAVLRGDFPMQDIIEIGDALLAAPVLALEISLDSHLALEALAELRQRAGPHLLIGASDIRTVEQVRAAQAAGAQFVGLAGADVTVIAYCLAQQIFPLPQVSNLAEAEQSVGAGCRLLKFSAAAGRGLAILKTLPAVLGKVEVVATGDISMASVAEYAQAGAVAVAVGHLLIAEPYGSMAEIISKARALLARWEEAQQRLASSRPG